MLSQTGKTKTKQFKNSSGDKLFGIITNPTQSIQKPIITFAHGLRSSKDSDTYTVLADRLAKHNISSLRFDFTGHGESEGDFSQITFTQAIDDLKKALSYLNSHNYNQIGLMGSSFGGLASLVVTSQTPNPKLLALKSPVSYYPDTLKTPKRQKILKKWQNQGHRIYQNKHGKKSKLNHTFYQDSKKYNAHQIASQIKIPTLIVHGDQDQTVPYQQSLKLSKLIPNCRLVTIKGGEHQYSNPKHREKMYQEITSFILKYS